MYDATVCIMQALTRKAGSLLVQTCTYMRPLLGDCNRVTATATKSDDPPPALTCMCSALDRQCLLPRRCDLGGRVLISLHAVWRTADEKKQLAGLSWRADQP